MALGWRHGRHRWAGVAVAAAVMAGGMVWRTGPAGADSTLPVGQAVTLAAPGVGLAKPADGALDGFNFDGQVNGSECGPAAGTGAQAVTAAAGAQICVFTVHFNGDSVDFLDIDNKAFPPTLAVTAPGMAAVAIPLTEATDAVTAGGTFAVGVPAGGPVSLVATAKGFAQSFDLRAGKRLAPDPVGLYRGGVSSVVDDIPTVTASLTATRSDTGEASSWQLQVFHAYVSYFAPVTFAPAPSPAQAYVVVKGAMASQDPSVSDLNPDPLAGNDVHLVLPGGQSVAGQPVGGSTGDLFTDYYVYVVPGDVTAASLQVTIPDPVAMPSRLTATKPALAFTGTATIPLAWPTASSDLPATPATSPPGVNRPGAGTAVRAAPTTVGNYSPPLTPIKKAIRGLEIAALAAIVLAVGVFAARRRHRLLPAGPVVRSQAALRAATHSELMRGPEWPALGPAPGVLGPAPGPTQTWGQTKTAAGGQTWTGYVPVPALVVRVLGPLEVEGLARTVPRKVLVRLLVCLVLSRGRAVGVDELRDATAADPDQTLSVSSMHEAVSRLRKALPDGLLPPVPAGADGYHLAGDIEVDWALFVELTGRAATVEGSDRLELLCRAMRLIRGVPLANGTWAGVDGWVRHIETTVEAAAADAARLALQLRDARTADWAAYQGLLAVPGSPVLHELRLVAAAGGSGAGLERVWAQTCESLGPDAEALRGTYERLRAGSY